MTIDWPALRVGSPVPPVTIDVSLQRLVVAAGGERDFNPLHFDSDHARSCRFRAAFANGLFLQAMVDRTMTDFTGPTGEIRSLRLKMTAPVYVDTVLTIEGAVSSLSESDGWGSIDAALDLRTDDGLCATAHVIARVPIAT